METPLQCFLSFGGFGTECYQYYIYAIAEAINFSPSYLRMRRTFSANIVNISLLDSTPQVLFLLCWIRLSLPTHVWIVGKKLVHKNISVTLKWHWFRYASVYKHLIDDDNTYCIGSGNSAVHSTQFASVPRLILNINTRRLLLSLSLPSKRYTGFCSRVSSPDTPRRLYNWNLEVPIPLVFNYWLLLSISVYHNM